MKIEEIDIDKVIKCRFVEPIDNKIDELVHSIDNIQFNHVEVNNILKQVYQSLNSIKLLINNNDYVSSNSSIRSSLEHIATAVAINESEKAYEEFVNLSLSHSKMKETKSVELINTLNEVTFNIIKQKYYNNEPFENDPNFRDSVFYDTTNINLYDIYGYLCKFTHGSLFVSSYVNYDSTEEKEWLKKNVYMLFYFVKFIYYLILMYYSGEEDFISAEHIIYTCILYLYSIINFAKENNVNNSKLFELTYENHNEDFYSKGKNNAEIIAKQIKFILECTLAKGKENNSLTEYLNIG